MTRQRHRKTVKFVIMGALTMIIGISFSLSAMSTTSGQPRNSITLHLARDAATTPIPFVLNLNEHDPMTQRPYRETLCNRQGVLIGVVKNLCQAIQIYDGPTLINTLRRTEPAKKNSLIIHYFLAPSCEQEFQYVGDLHTVPDIITAYASLLHDHACQRAKKSSPLKLLPSALALGLAQYEVALFFEAHHKQALAISWYEKAGNNGCEKALLALDRIGEKHASDAEEHTKSSPEPCAHGSGLLM